MNLISKTKKLIWRVCDFFDTCLYLLFQNDEVLIPVERWTVYASPISFYFISIYRILSELKLLAIVVWKVEMSIEIKIL